MTDLARAKRFYETVLGRPVVESLFLMTYRRPCLVARCAEVTRVAESEEGRQYLPP